MDLSYKICFLGYGQLTAMAQKVISGLDYKDTEIFLIDCTAETLPEIVDDALNRGYDVFVAGSANAAAFPRHSHAPLCEIIIQDIDYLTAIKKALTIGQCPAIATYRFSRSINIDLLSELAGTKVGHIIYEDSIELYGAVQSSNYDVIIGASQANECADKLGRKGVLLYAGEDSVLRTINQARSLAIDLQKEQRINAINRTIIRNSPLGIIVCDEAGRISLINQIAQNYIGIPAALAHGHMLSEITSNLFPNALLASDVQQMESYKILNGVRVRCIQNKIRLKNQNIGVLTTLHIDNRSKKRMPAAPGIATAAHWKDLIINSDHMRKAVSLGKKYAASDLPLSIWGEQGIEKVLFAECVHTGSHRVQQPLLSVNLSSISENDAGRHLLGCDDQSSPHIGLLELANNGTMILRNLEHANTVVQDCLLDVVNRKQIIRTGGYDPIPVDIRFITLINTPFDKSAVRSDLLNRLCTLHLTHPTLSERREDIPQLFTSFVRRTYDRPFDLENYPWAKETLCFYSWPGNMFELNIVVDRFVAQLTEASRITQQAIHHMVITSIGREQLFNDIIQKYPGLGTTSFSPDQQREAIETIKYHVGYNNSIIAQKLGISRTSLWRATKYKTS